MKKVILAVASIALWASCIEDEKDYSQIIETRVANCETSKDFSVPVKEGYTTFVISGEDTLAMANEPITIRYPQKRHNIDSCRRRRYQHQLYDSGRRIGNNLRKGVAGHHVRRYAEW